VNNRKPKVPIIKNIHQKVYAAASKPGALNMDFWHKCKTTHCRAGWVVTLAGKAGKALEDHYGMADEAAIAIYKASGYKINPWRFYDSNEVALADMKRLAEEEKADARKSR